MLIRDILGIDFGTTNSKVAYLLLDEPEVIENLEGNPITPSAVYFKGENEYTVGETAKRNMILHPDRVVCSIKREMGTQYVKKVGRHSFPAEYVGALIFKKIVDDAEKRTGKKFSDAVVSVPANYSDSQRQAIRDAAEIAGINVVRLINEPTAAALAYGIREDLDKKVLVYDFGGGTFDVSVLTVSSGFFDVDASTGEHRLGGDDIDARIIMCISARMMKETGINPEVSPGLRATLREAAEEAKIRLSSEMSTTITIPFIAPGKPPFQMELSRSDLEALISDLIQRTVIPIEQALTDAGIEKTDIDEVILVGGTTLMPAVRRFVKEYFDREPLLGDPYTAVARGAALAGMEMGMEKSRTARNIEISDVVSCSLGIRILDGTLSKIIERNTKIPIARSRMYTNVGDYAEEVIIPVYQGDELMAEENELLGHFWISIEPMPAGENQIKVTFEIGEEFGILHVTAIDADSGNMRSVKMESRSRLPKKDKEKWMKKLLGRGSIHVYITSADGSVTVDQFLNPAGTVADLKKDLRQKGLYKAGEDLVHQGTVLYDDERIRDLSLEENASIGVVANNGL